MRRVELLPLFGLLATVLLLSACVQSQTPLLTNTRPATPLPAAFVVASTEGKPEAERFDREDDTYVAVRNGVRTTYRLYPMEDMTGPTGSFFIAMETNANADGANYGLIELAPGEMVVHGFDAKALAAELRLKADEFGMTVEADEQLMDVFARVAEDAVDGRTDVTRFKVLDLGIPDQRAQADRAMEEARKAEDAD